MSETAPSTIVQSWLWDSQIAVKNNYIKTINGNYLIFLEKHLFSSTCLLTKERETSQDFFFYTPSWGIFKNSHYNKATVHSRQSAPPPYFTLPSRPFQAKIFRHPFPSILDSKIRLPSFVKEATGVELWGGFTPYMVPIGTISPLVFCFPYNRVPYFESK